MLQDILLEFLILKTFRKPLAVVNHRAEEY